MNASHESFWVNEALTVRNTVSITQNIQATNSNFNFGTENLNIMISKSGKLLEYLFFKRISVTGILKSIHLSFYA